MDSGTLQVPALGRPFNVGMLYDCRADNLVPGITLWDHEKLQQDMTVTVQPNTECQIVASESISDKSSSLGVNASLKASFLGGLVSVEGSANYLNDNKSSKNQARVTLKYKTTTEYRQLTMNQLGTGNIKHPEVFEKGIATHVVTAILYGAQAFFVFDQETTETEQIQDIQGNLHLVINKLPLISIDGQGDLKMEDKDREKVQKVSCKFYGDFHLDQSPVTFEDAVRVYQDLPKLLGPNGEKAIPVQVWLLPLTTLDSKAAKLVRQISVRLVSEAQSVLEDFNDVEIRCNDVLKRPAVRHFPQIAKKIKTFMKFCSDSKLELQGTMASKLPSIRGGAEEEGELAEFLKETATSPFNNSSLNQWMDCRETEAFTLMSITNLLNTKVLSTQSDLLKETFQIKNAVCFVFTSLGSADPYLCALDKYLKQLHSDELGLRSEDEENQWYCSEDLRDQIQHKAKLFRDFSEANQDNKNVKFITIGLTDEKHKGSTIYLYKNGFKTSKNFEPPSKPEAVSVEDVTLDCVTLRFSAPKHGSEPVTGYRVEYCVRGETVWNQHPNPNPNPAAVTVTGLKANTEYSFRVRVITDVGLGPAAQITSIKTVPGPEGPRSLAEVRKKWKLLKTQGLLQVLEVPLVKEELNIDGCEQFVYRKYSLKTNRTIVLLGAADSGKSTLIDRMVNYIFGVQWSDSYRFKMVPRPLTSNVTVYKLNHQDGFKIDFSLTVVDTPGFGDNLQADEETLKQIQKLFCSEMLFSDVHAVCLVVQAASPRPSVTLHYVFDSVLSLFGQDMAENVRILVTFADGSLPQVLQKMRDAGVTWTQTPDQPYKFNNAALFTGKQSSAEDDFGEIFWKMGEESMRNFFDAFEQTEPKTLTLTKEVIRETKQLVQSAENIYKGLASLAITKMSEELIHRHEARIKTEIQRGNIRFGSDFTLTKPFQINISETGHYITNCKRCQHTCHYPCPCGQDKKDCEVMDHKGNCRECPGQCGWRQHLNQDFLWVKDPVIISWRVGKLMNRYEQSTTEGLLSKLRGEHQILKDNISEMLASAKGSLDRLKAIALRPRFTSSLPHIDLLILSERTECSHGWEEQISLLIEVRKKTKILAEIEEGKDLLGE